VTANNNSQAPAPGVASSSPGQAEGLQRRLSARQLTMIAIGGAIGVGLFLGSSVTIELAGPGVIITYLLGAAVALVMAYALAEMAVTHPVAGSFGVYAEIYLSRWAGFTIRTTYGLVQIIAIGAEVTAVAIYFAFWFPNVPAWSWVLIVSTALVTINALQVSNFGEFEYWFALIKVVAIIAFIGVGLSLITGLGPWPAVGLANLTQHGGFLPRGWRGVWLALTLAITSYMGVEVIAVTAGEAHNPEESIPRAMRTIVFRLIIFYVLAISVMLAMTPWNHIGSANISGSPFVRAFETAGIPFAASIMNLVVISAALSSANTNLYLSTRMLFSLARGQYAPAWLGLRVEMDAIIFDADVLDRPLGQAQHIAGAVRDVCAGHVLERDVARRRRAIVDRAPVAVADVEFLAVRIAPIEAVDHERRADALHVHVAQADAIDDGALAAAAPRLQAQAPIGADEKAVARADVVDAGPGFRADDDGAVAVLHQAIGDANTARGDGIALGERHLARLDADAVVAGRDVAADDVDVLAGVWVDAVGVRRCRRRFDLDIGDDDLARAERMQRP